MAGTRGAAAARVAACLAALTLLTGCAGETSGTSPSATAIDDVPTPGAPSAAPSAAETSPDPSPAAVPSGTGSDGVYVALGDSLAAGFVLPGGADPARAYPALAARILLDGGVDLAVTNLACSGETTASMLDGGRCSYDLDGQLAQAERLIATTEDVRLVTINIGANDVLSCITSSAVYEDCLQTRLSEAEARLQVILTRLREVSGPQAVLAVLTYYDVFQAPSARPAAPGVDAAGSAGVVELNGAITRAALSVDGIVVKMSEVAETADDVCDLTYRCAFGDIHLTPRGQQHLSEIVAAAVEPELATR